MRPLARLGAVQRSQGENPQQGVQRLPGAAQRLVEMGELGQRLDEAHQQHQHGHQPRAVQPLPLHRPGAAEQGEDLALVDGQGHGVHRQRLVELLGYPVDLYQHLFRLLVAL